MGWSRMGAEEDNQEAGRNCVTRNFMICTPHLSYPGDHIEENEMGGACSTLWERRNACMVWRLRLLCEYRHCAHCTECWVGPRACLHMCRKSRPTGIRSLDHPARGQLLYRLSYAGPRSVLRHYPWLGLFAKFRNATSSFVVWVSVPPFLSVRQHATVGPPRDRFTWNFIFQICFETFVEKIQVSLESDNNSRWFTRRPMYIFYHISLHSF
jgi:hypothetical protein